MFRGDRQRLIADACVALSLALVLAAGWAWRDWAALSRLRLPDTDDLMRLQQVRDWLVGQPFADLSQHRLGPTPGLPMHWSRLADFGPAALITAFAPLLGRHGAEVAAVISWPPLLFAAALFLVGRIARRIAAPPATAILVAAIAYPATTVFMPGRIDHHGLQLVLLLAVTLATIGPASVARGATIGVGAAASLFVGLETVPLVGLVGAAAAIRWVMGERDAEDRLMGLGIGAVSALIAASLAFGTWQWDYPACDGFDAASWRAALTLSLAPVALALTGGRGSPARRAAAATLVGGIAVAAACWSSPACLSPYGAVDPLVARLWLAHVAEAQPLFAAPPVLAIGQAGLLVAGIAAGAWWAWRRRTAPTVILFALQLGAFAITCFQLRGAYAGTILAAPALAAVIAAARARGGLRIAAAWLASAGILYPIAAQALPRPPGPAGAAGCDAGRVLDALATAAPMRLLAPIDLGAGIVATTPHTAIAGPYHRNDAGNRAALRAFLGPAGSTVAIARAARADALLWCAGQLGDTPPPAGSAAALLVAGRPVPGLGAGLPLPGGARLYPLPR